MMALMCFCVANAQTLAEKIEKRQQLTNLATVYFDIPDAYGKDINEVLFKDRKNNIADYHQTTIQVVENGCNDGTGRTLGNFTEAGLEIKVRGNSTAEMDKRPYRLRFYKDEKDAAGNVTASHKHDMLGYGYEKRNWTILNNMRDGSLMQNAITYYIGKAVGMPFCPGYKFVDLVINNEYRGCYQLSDHVEVGSHRIEVDEDTGWFVESTRHDMTEEPYFNDAALYVLIKSPESKTEAGTAEIKEMIRQYFVNNNINIFGIWNTGCDDKTFCDPKRGWRSVFDEETLVKFYIGTNLTGDYDGLMQVKMYREENGKMHFGPLWDKDLAFGVQGGSAVVEGEGTDYGAQEFSNYVKKIRNTDPVFVKKVHDKLHEMLDNGYIDNLMTEIGKLEASLLESKTLEYNNTGWKATSVENYPAAVERLRQYIKDHTEYFTNFIDEKYEDMGGDDIVDNTIGGSDEDTDTEETPETGPALNTEYTVPDMGFKGEYVNYPIPASAFNSKATSALITVSGAYYIKFVYRLNQWGYSQDALAVFPNKGNIPQTGTYLVEGDMLQRALKGELAVNCDGNSNIIVTVFNYGTNEPVTPPAPTRAQLTNLPTIYLDAATINGEWQSATLEVFDSEDKLHASTWKAMTTSVQYQGSGSGEKDSYRFKFESKTQMLSDKYKQWVLLANDDDPSMLNNALTKKLGDAIGMPWTPGCQFVDLYVNDTYMGTYQVTDRVKAEDGRSLVSGGNKDADWQVRFNDDTELSEDGTSDYVAASGVNVIYKNPDPKDLTAAQIATLRSDMTDYFTTVFASNSDGEFTGFTNNVDKTQLVNWYISQEILGVYKGFSSIEAYRSVTSTAADQLLHFGPLWDSEKAFGNTGSAPAIDMSDLSIVGSHKGLMIEYASFGKMKDLFNYLWTLDWFKTAVTTKWNELYTGSTETGLAQALKSEAASLAETLAESQAKNLAKWPNSLEYNSTSHAKHADFNGAVASIATYIDQRFPYVDKKFKELAEGAQECVDHEYNRNVFAKNDDGTYYRKCDICDKIEENGEKYYEFTVYPESAETYTVKATSWTPTADKPNSIAVVNVVKSIADNISGYNIVCGIKSLDAEGEERLTCKDFRLTDGHPYYSNHKFVAASASYSRNITTNAWGTLVLPYKMQNAETDYASFYHLSEVKTKDGDASTLVFKSISPDVSGDCSAYIPVVFQATDKALKEGKLVVTGEDITVKKTTSLDDTDLHNEIETVADWSLVGTIAQTRIKEKGVDYANGTIYYIKDNKFYYVPKSSSYTSNPFRAYYVCSNADNAVKTFSIGLPDEQETETGLDTVDASKALKIFVESTGVSLYAGSETSVKICSASGALIKDVKLDSSASVSVALPSGIYLVNDVKVIVK